MIKLLLVRCNSKNPPNIIFQGLFCFPLFFCNSFAFFPFFLWPGGEGGRCFGVAEEEGLRIPSPKDGGVFTSVYDYMVNLFAGIVL